MALNESLFCLFFIHFDIKDINLMIDWNWQRDPFKPWNLKSLVDGIVCVILLTAHAQFDSQIKCLLWNCKFKRNAFKSTHLFIYHWLIAWVNNALIIDFDVGIILCVETGDFLEFQKINKSNRFRFVGIVYSLLPFGSNWRYFFRLNEFHIWFEFIPLFRWDTMTFYSLTIYRFDR